MSQEDSRRVLLVTYKAPVDRLSGNDLRLWHLLGRGDADVLCFRQVTIDVVGREITNPLPWRSLDVVPGGPDDWAGIANRVIAALSGGPVLVNIYPVLTHVPWLRAIAYPFNAHFPDSLSLAYRRKFQAASLMRPASIAAAYIRHRQWIRAEAEIGRLAETCILTGAADKAAFGGGRAPCVAVGNGTDWCDMPALYQSREGGHVLGFHGNLGWPPNVSAVEFLCRQVLPRIRREIPDAELRIAGGPLTPHTLRLNEIPGVSMLGYVEDVRSFLGQCDLFVAPMVEGSGVKNKLLEAMAAGMPVLTNPMGAEGLDRPGRSLISVGADAAALAREAVALLRNPERRLAMSGEVRRHAAAHYGWEPHARQFRETLRPATS